MRVNPPALAVLLVTLVLGAPSAAHAQSAAVRGNARRDARDQAHRAIGSTMLAVQGPRASTRVALGTARAALRRYWPRTRAGHQRAAAAHRAASSAHAGAAREQQISADVLLRSSERVGPRDERALRSAGRDARSASREHATLRELHAGLADYHHERGYTRVTLRERIAPSAIRTRWRETRAARADVRALRTRAAAARQVAMRSYESADIVGMQHN